MHAGHWRGCGGISNEEVSFPAVNLGVSNNQADLAGPDIV
jgi:hypothetical protein